MNNSNIIASAVRTIRSQAESISALEGYINSDFVTAVERIATNPGRLVISGIGKSAIIAQKLAATLNSTGTPSLFMHAADAIHGDLGMIQSQDIVLIISKSGDSPEIKVLIPFVKGFGNLIIGMGGNLNSFLAKQSDLYLNTTVEQESCPNNLAPTNSTTAQMVMGDALAVSLMERSGFKKEDFAKYHPGGALGKKLFLRVSDLLSEQQPKVGENTSVKEVILAITKHRLGAVAVEREDGEIVGIVTDGDVRRMLEKYEQFSNLTASTIMTSGPKCIEKDAMAIEAFELMKNHHINQLLVLNDKKYCGMIHIQDLIREGII
jgi:arabinose-5-phosphate isomerase